MSDNLRDALEQLVSERDSVSGHVGSDYHIRPYELRELLAAHPVEPAGVSDEVVQHAVIAAARVPAYGTPEGVFDAMRAALEAALPYLLSRPTLADLLAAIDAYKPSNENTPYGSALRDARLAVRDAFEAKS